MPEPEPESDVDLIAACIDALQVEGPVALERLLAQHPDRAAMLRARLARLEAAGLLTPAGERPTAIPQELGDYRLLRCIGSGGMGVVYLAEQRSLGRTVALKLLRPEQRYFPGAAARFRREVEAVARLGDPGIVPIYTVGEEQGVDYFTMEYVRGATLADAIAALTDREPAELRGKDLLRVAAARAEVAAPTATAETFAGSWLETACRVVARMARAAHHAHERGVVHRDLKPNNAMVTPDGRVLLLDFGLASADGSSRITRTGALLGTLHYMAPEQLLGGAVDARTDVYALGATLHELVTLTPPFAAESSEALRHAILHGERERLARRHPEAPRDVETIVAKAMAREPQHRYGSAEQLADDLERFLLRRPILARPAGPLLRLHRWTLRHPAKATAAGLCLVALAATPALVHLSRGEAEAQLADAQALARTNLDGAVLALETMVQTARNGAASRTPGLDAERLRQLDVAVAQIAALRRENPQDPRVRSAFARGMVHAAEVRALLGRFTEALAELEQAEAEIAELTAGAPIDVHAVNERVVALLVRGTILVGLDRLPEAADCWREAIAAAAAIDLDVAPPSLLTALASCHNNLGRIARGAGDTEAALRHLETSLSIEARVPPGTLNLEQRLDAIRTRINVAALQRQRGEFTQAKATFRSLLETLEGEATRDAEAPELRREIARTRFALAQIDQDLGDPAAAAQGHQTAFEMLERLVNEFPDRIAYRQELSGIAFAASSRASERRDLTASRRWIDLALQQQEALLRIRPDSAEILSDLATYLRQSAALSMAAGDAAKAMDELERGRELIERAVVLRPDDPHHRVQAGALHQDRTMMHLRSERWAEARTEARAAVAEYERAVAAGHAPASDPSRLPKALMLLAQAELMCDDADGIMRALTRLHQVRPFDARALRDVGEKLHVDDREDFRALLRSLEPTVR